MPGESRPRCRSDPKKRRERRKQGGREEVVEKAGREGARKWGREEGGWAGRLEAF